MSGDDLARLAELRTGIGAVDEALIRLLSKRFELVDRLAEIKRAEGVPIEDPERERALCRQYEALCARETLDAETAKRIFHAIFAESKARQREARGEAPREGS